MSAKEAITEARIVLPRENEKEASPPRLIVSW